MDVFISIQVVGEGYTQLAQRDIRLTELASAADIKRIAYGTGSLVGVSLLAIAAQLKRPAAIRHSIPDDAPATMFAPAPVGAYRRGFEDMHYDHAWFCPYRPGTAEAGEYAAGHRAASELERKDVT